VTDPLSVVEHKFRPPHWIFMREFRNDTGFNANRSADALAVGLYHSRGQLVMGFEQKLSRADWLRELRDAEKAEDIGQYCDHWNVVVGDVGIVEPDELPPSWGLMLASGKKLRSLRPAPRLRPKAMTRAFMAAIIKRAVDDAVRPHLATDHVKHREAEQEGFERGKLAAAREYENLAQLQQRVEAFEAASGIRIDRWSADAGKLGRAVSAVLRADGTVERARRDLGFALNGLRQLADTMAKFIADIDERSAAGRPAEAEF
jgi:hypothetical protein